MKKRFVLPDGGDVVVSAGAAMRLIARGDGPAALLYIYILKMGGFFDPEEAAEALSMTSEGLSAAAGALGELGLVALEEEPSPAGEAKAPVSAPRPAPKKPAPETPAPAPEPSAPGPEPSQNPYTAAEVLDEMERKGEFTAFVTETERRLSMARPCNMEELKRLMWLYHDAGLPMEVLFLLVTYCAQEWDRRYGGSRRPTISQIEKEGARWARMELDSQEAASKYIRRRRRLLSDMGQAAQLLGIGGRPLAPSEEKYLAAWLDMGFKPPEIQEAYDRTVLATGSLSWKYMNSIIKRWNEQGLRSLRDIREADAAPRDRAAAPRGRSDAAPARSGADPMKAGSLSWVKSRIKKKEEEGR